MSTLSKLFKSIRKKIDDVTLFLSGSFKKLLGDISENFLGSAGKRLNIELVPKGNYIAYTDLNKVRINIGSVLVQKTFGRISTRVEKARTIIGLLVHEMCHILWTNKKDSRKVVEEYRKCRHIWPLCEYEEEISNAAEINDWFKTAEKHRAEKAFEIFHRICNILEDGYIDKRCIEEKKPCSEHLKFVHKKAIFELIDFESLLSFNEGKKNKARTFPDIDEELLLNYAKYGIILCHKESISPKPHPALLRLNNIIPTILEAKDEDDAYVRLVLEQTVAAYYWPAIVAYLESLTITDIKDLPEAPEGEMESGDGGTGMEDEEEEASASSKSKAKSKTSTPPPTYPDEILYDSSEEKNGESEDESEAEAEEDSEGDSSSTDGESSSDKDADEESESSGDSTEEEDGESSSSDETDGEDSKEGSDGGSSESGKDDAGEDSDDDEGKTKGRPDEDDDSFDDDSFDDGGDTSEGDNSEEEESDGSGESSGDDTPASPDDTGKTGESPDDSSEADSNPDLSELEKAREEGEKKSGSEPDDVKSDEAKAEEEEEEKKDSEAMEDLAKEVEKALDDLTKEVTKSGDEMEAAGKLAAIRNRDDTPFKIDARSSAERFEKADVERFFDRCEDLGIHARSISRNIIREFQQKIKDKHNGRKLSGFWSGQSISMKALSRNEDAFFERKKLPSDYPSLAVAYLGDESGSMCCTAVTNGAGSMSRADINRLCAIEVYDFCVALGIPVGIYGHTVTYDVRGDRGDGVVQLYKYADFSTPPKASDRNKLMDIAARSDNRDGSALRLACERLLQQPATERVIIVTSDGQPAASNYCGETGILDTQAAAREYTRKGIKIIAAAMASDKDVIKRMYGDDSFLDITDVNKMPKKLVGILAKFVR